MTTRYVETEQARTLAIRFLRSHPLPFTLSVTKKGKRSVEQNRLQRLWVKEAEDQLHDMRAEDYRGYCKLHFGVPILRNEDEEFRQIYDEVIRPLPYEAKLKCMMVPIDLPVTSQMNTGQNHRYLNDMYDYLTSLGVVLTEPKDKWWDEVLKQKEAAE